MEHDRHGDGLDDDGLVTVRLTRAEVVMVAGALREVLEAVDDWEFQTLLGWEKADLRPLEVRFADLCRRLPPEG